MLDLSESTVSHHLGQLRKAGLVISDRRGMNVFHRVKPEALQALCVVLDPQLLHLAVRRTVPYCSRQDVCAARSTGGRLGEGCQPRRLAVGVFNGEA